MCKYQSAHWLDPVIANLHRRKRRKPRFTIVDFKTRLYWITNHWKPKVHGTLKKSSNRPFALWHHFTITTRILQGFAFLCKWGLLLFKPHWDSWTKFKYERRNENDSGRSSKITPSCKWPITCLQILLRGMGNHVTVHRPTARASVRTTGQPMFNLTLSS